MNTAEDLAGKYKRSDDLQVVHSATTDKPFERYDASGLEDVIEDVSNDLERQRAVHLLWMKLLKDQSRGYDKEVEVLNKKKEILDTLEEDKEKFDFVQYSGKLVLLERWMEYLPRFYGYIGEKTPLFVILRELKKRANRSEDARIVFHDLLAQLDLICELISGNDEKRRVGIGNSMRRLQEEVDKHLSKLAAEGGSHGEKRRIAEAVAAFKSTASLYLVLMDDGRRNLQEIKKEQDHAISADVRTLKFLLEDINIKFREDSLSRMREWLEESERKVYEQVDKWGKESVDLKVKIAIPKDFAPGKGIKDARPDEYMSKLEELRILKAKTAGPKEIERKKKQIRKLSDALEELCVLRLNRKELSERRKELSERRKELLKSLPVEGKSAGKEGTPRQELERLRDKEALYKKKSLVIIETSLGSLRNPDKVSKAFEEFKENPIGNASLDEYLKYLDKGGSRRVKRLKAGTTPFTKRIKSLEEEIKRGNVSKKEIKRIDKELKKIEGELGELDQKIKKKKAKKYGKRLQDIYTKNCKGLSKEGYENLRRELKQYMEGASKRFEEDLRASSETEKRKNDLMRELPLYADKWEDDLAQRLIDEWNAHIASLKESLKVSVGKPRPKDFYVELDGLTIPPLGDSDLDGDVSEFLITIGKRLEREWRKMRKRYEKIKDDGSKAENPSDVESSVQHKTGSKDKILEACEQRLRSSGARHRDRARYAGSKKCENDVNKYLNTRKASDTAESALNVLRTDKEWRKFSEVVSKSFSVKGTSVSVPLSFLRTEEHEKLKKEIEKEALSLLEDIRKVGISIIEKRAWTVARGRDLPSADDLTRRGQDFVNATVKDLNERLGEFASLLEEEINPSSSNLSRSRYAIIYTFKRTNVSLYQNGIWDIIPEVRGKIGELRVESLRRGGLLRGKGKSGARLKDDRVDLGQQMLVYQGGDVKPRELAEKFFDRCCKEIDGIAEKVMKNLYKLSSLYRLAEKVGRDAYDCALDLVLAFGSKCRYGDFEKSDKIYEIFEYQLQQCRKTDGKEPQPTFEYLCQDHVYLALLDALEAELGTSLDGVFHTDYSKGLEFVWKCAKGNPPRAVGSGRRGRR